MKIENAKAKFIEKTLPKENTRNRVSIYAEDYKGEYYNLPVEKLLPFKSQARKHFDQESIDALAGTIKEHGIRQPLTVLPSEDKEGYYEIISGERRHRAAMQVGLKLVPCIIYHDREKAEEVALIENIQRKDLHPIELMYAYTHLLEKGICSSIQSIADKLGLSKSAVGETMTLKVLPENTREYLLKGQIKARALLRELCKASPEDHEQLINRFVDKDNTDKVTASRKKAIHTKTKVLNIVYDNNMFVVEKNRIVDLSIQQKEEIRSILLSIIDNT